MVTETRSRPTSAGLACPQGVRPGSAPVGAVLALTLHIYGEQHSEHATGLTLWAPCTTARATGPGPSSTSARLSAGCKCGREKALLVAESLNLALLHDARGESRPCRWPPARPSARDICEGIGRTGGTAAAALLQTFRGFLDHYLSLRPERNPGRRFTLPSGRGKGSVLLRQWHRPAPDCPSGEGESGRAGPPAGLHDPAPRLAGHLRAAAHLREAHARETADLEARREQLQRKGGAEPVRQRPAGRSARLAGSTSAAAGVRWSITLEFVHQRPDPAGKVPTGQLHRWRRLSRAGRPISVQDLGRLGPPPRGSGRVADHAQAPPARPGGRRPGPPKLSHLGPARAVEGIKTVLCLAGRAREPGAVRTLPGKDPCYLLEEFALCVVPAAGPVHPPSWSAACPARGPCNPSPPLGDVDFDGASRRREAAPAGARAAARSGKEGACSPLPGTG